MHAVVYSLHFTILARLFKLAIHALTVDLGEVLAHIGDPKPLETLIGLTIALLARIPSTQVLRGVLGKETGVARVDDHAHGFTRLLEFSGTAVAGDTPAACASANVDRPTAASTRAE